MSKEQKKKIRTVLKELNPDTIGTKKNGAILCRWGYYYRHGKTDLAFAEAVKSKLDENDIDYSDIDSGDHWTSFKGGASVANSSHFWVEIKLV